MISYDINIIPDKILLCIENVFSEIECNNLIKLSENNGYYSLNIDEYDINYRSGFRSIIYNISFAKTLEEAIINYIPQTYNNMKYNSINPQFRYLKYDNSGHFNRHSDHPYSTNKIISTITILIYLNNNYEGGYTTFYKDINDKKGIIIIPKIGMICLMDQTIGHEVPELKKGIKYIIRTELMYTLNNKSIYDNLSNEKIIIFKNS
jgi:hypothetical protein